MNKSINSKIEHNQNFYHLSCIQCVGQSVPAAMIGKFLSDQYGAGTAVCSIIIGNLILWLIGLGVISMVYEAHTNAIENIKSYLGKYGSLTFALGLLSAFMFWYVNQISGPVSTLKSIPQFNEVWAEGFDIRIGAVLGLLSAILALGGIRLLRLLSTSTFPLLVIYYVYAILHANHYPAFAGTWGISATAVVMVILLDLPGVINLPTFFRHSKSRANSFLALSLMTIFVAFFECATIWMDFSTLFEFIGLNSTIPVKYTQIIPFTFFLLLTSICSNMLNIYLASACYESFIPKFNSTKGQAIMGLLGTAAYTFIQISGPIIFTINMLNNYIGVMGIVLLIAVVARLVIKHRPRTFEKSINFGGWLIGCTICTYFGIKYPEQTMLPLFYGMEGSLLFFAAIFLTEEMIYSIRKVRIAQN